MGRSKVTKEENKALKELAMELRARAADLHFDGQLDITLNRQEFKALFYQGEIVGQRGTKKVEFYYLGLAVKLDKKAHH